MNAAKTKGNDEKVTVVTVVTVESSSLPTPGGRTPMRVKALTTIFKDMTTEEDWHDDEERAEVERFKQLVRTIEGTLWDVKVFQVGKSEADVYVVGRTDEGWAGLRTKVVET